MSGFHICVVLLWGILFSSTGQCGCPCIYINASQEAQWQRICLPMQETQEMQVRSLGWEDPLEKKMATHSSILACRIPWTEEPRRLQCMGSQRVGHEWSDLARTYTYITLYYLPWLCSMILYIVEKVLTPYSFFFRNVLATLRASLIAQLVKNAPAMQETLVQALGWEDSQEKGKAAHPSILAQRIPWTVWSLGSQKARHDWATSLTGYP